MLNLHLFNAAKLQKHRIRKIREAIPSVPRLLGDLRKKPNNTGLGKRVHMCLCACVSVCVYVHVCIYVHTCVL